jgi:hypothetical protein
LKNDNVSAFASKNPNCPPEYAWLWKNKMHNPTDWFLNYLDASPTVKNDPYITKLVKTDLVKTLNDFFNGKTLLMGKTLLIGKDKDKIKKLVDYFGSNDFVISLYKNKIFNN